MRLRIFGLLSLCVLSAGYSRAQVAVGEGPGPASQKATSPARTLCFDEGWRFHFGNASDPSKDFRFGLVPVFAKTGKAEGSAIDSRFDDNKWDQVRLPHDWAVALPFVYADNPDVASHGYKPVGALFPETSIGWYRKKFRVDPADSGSRYVLQFDGIFRDAQIWVNGIFLGRNMSGYVGVSFDISDYLDFHRDNVVVVRVDATQYEGWFYEGAGIYRHTWLHTYRPVHIPADGIFVHSDVRGLPEPEPDTARMIASGGPKAGHGFTMTLRQDADVHVESTIVNSNGQAGSFTCETYLTDRNGNRVGESVSRQIDLPARNSRVNKVTISVKEPRLWSPDDPYLYRAVTLVRAGTTVVDSVSTRFGIRDIRLDPQWGLFLNGRHVKIKGVNCHPDHAGVGSALPDALQYYRVRKLKEFGVNAYRTAHYAPAPELLDACDSLGLLVVDEQRLLNSSPEYLDQFERLLRRDRSRACVFLWSIGNEEGYIQTRSVGRRIAQTLIALQRDLDPTRTCTYAADLPDVYNGVNEVIPVRGFNYRQFAAAAYHKEHPGQPILGTEMGSTVTTRGEYSLDSVKGYVPDQDITAPWWASKAETWWPLAADNPWWIGGFVWTGFDYRGEPTPFLWPDIHSHFGIMDDCGFAKNIYYYYKSWWSDEDVLHISPHWNWKGREGKPIDVWVNSNADKVELRLNGKSLGEKAMPRNGHLVWSVPYKAGRLEAVARRQGRRFNTVVETTGAASRLVLVPDTNCIKADGKDAIVLNVYVVDKEGREVPDAADEIHFSLEGPGRFIGVGNGDPSSHEADQCPDGQWQRRLFHGKCQIILQSSGASGMVSLKAEAAGLQLAQASIRAGM